MIVRWLIIAVVLVALSWIVMIVLARRLPPGLAKDLATVLPACVTTARRLRKSSLNGAMEPPSPSPSPTSPQPYWPPGKPVAGFGSANADT